MFLGLRIFRKNKFMKSILRLIYCFIYYTYLLLICYFIRIKICNICTFKEKETTLNKFLNCSFARFKIIYLMIYNIVQSYLSMFDFFCFCARILSLLREWQMRIDYCDNADNRFVGPQVFDRGITSGNDTCEIVSFDDAASFVAQFYGSRLMIMIVILWS